MMAAGEARAVWQRTVNRYFVQEDAKRAPKLTTSCQSSSSSSSAASTKQVEDSRPVVDPQDQSSCPSFMPRHPNPNFPHMLPHNTTLWGHHHHTQQNHKEQVKTPLEAEAEEAKSERFQEFIELMETRESYGSVGNDESSEKKLTSELAFDPSSPWNPLSSEKAAPWWRTTDKDELASLVAQRSLDFVENCDLPTPQKMNRSYYGSPRSFDSDAFRDHSFSNKTIHEHLLSRGNSVKKSTEEASSESDLSKSELLEALRRSQTRAREAENMAKEACAEKEHLVKLLLKQASELFGYKQLLQLLQLESLYLQIKSKKIEDTKETPPWSSTKARKQGRKRRSKRGKESGLVGFAWGLSLVGAGLLLGWTVGWMQMLSF